MEPHHIITKIDDGQICFDMKNLTKIFAEELGCKREEVTDPLDFAICELIGIDWNLPFHEIMDKYFDKFPFGEEEKKAMKDGLLALNMKNLNDKEILREVIQIYKRVHQIEQKQH